MTPWLLALLATTDVAFSAFRDAAGRNAYIDKRAYYRCALRGGASLGVAVVALCGALVLGALRRSPHPDLLYSDMMRAGAAMLLVYGPYAALTLAALVLWRLGDGELRTLMSVAILGPLTLLRHLLIPVGLAAALWRAEQTETRVVALVAVTLIGGAERVFAWVRRQRGGRLWLGEPVMPGARPEQAG